MNHLYRILPVLFLIALSASGMTAQNVVLNYQRPNNLFVCANDTFFIQIQNLANTPLLNGQLTLQLPAGISYLPGSVNGATQQNITNLQQAVFSLPVLPSGAQAAIFMLVGADCAAADILDEGLPFIANIKVESSLGLVQINTLPIKVETGLVLIDQVDDLLMSGVKGDTLYRKICVKNTRLGPITQLFFEDIHTPGFQITLNNTSSSANSFSTTFGSSFISQFGNGDANLEIGELACFTETIVITDCGTPAFTNQSLLRVGWGCGNTICRYDSTLANIQIQPFDKNPDLIIEPVWNAPLEHCAQTGVPAGVRVYNAGGGKADNVLLQFIGLNPAESGIQPGSFRFVTASGTAPVIPNVFLPNEICGEQVGKEASVFVPMIPPGDSLLVLFDYLTCVDPCKQVLPGFICNYFYTKTCPPDGFISNSTYILPDPAWTLDEELVVALQGCLQDGQTYDFLYRVRSRHLLAPEGTLKIEFTLPKSMSLDPACALNLGGVAPSNVQVTPIPDAGSQVVIEFPLPLLNDSLEMQLCLHYTCDSTESCYQDTSLASTGGSVIHFSPDCESPCLTEVKHRALYLHTPDTDPACAISDCGLNYIGVSRDVCTDDAPNPPGDTVIVYTVFPAKISEFKEIYRYNYGFKDPDNNRKADNFLPASRQEANDRRYMPGDTMRVNYYMSVDSGGNVGFYSWQLTHMVVRSDQGINDQDSFQVFLAKNGFTDEEKIRYLGDTVRIKYADGTEIFLPTTVAFFGKNAEYIQFQQLNTYPVVVFDEVAYKTLAFVVRFDTLFTYGILPKPSLDKGDSLFVSAYFQMDMNFTPPSNNNPDPPLVGFRTLFSPPSGSPVTLYTDNGYTKCQYTGYKDGWTNNAFTIRPCSTSIQSKPFRYSIRLARENFFPKEVRPLSRIKAYRQDKPDVLSILSAEARYLVLQDSVPVLQNTPLPFAEFPDHVDVDFSGLYAQPLDEGYSVETRFVFDPNCVFGKPDSSRQTLTLQYPPGMRTPDTLQQTRKNNLGYLSSVPVIRMISNDTIVQVPDKIFSANFSIQNQVISQTSNLWLQVISTSGQTSDFSIHTLPGNTQVFPQNGIYPLGDIGSFSTRNFSIKGRAYSCDSDTLLMIYGWDCSTSNIGQNACFKDTFIIVLRPVRPELELDILQEPEYATVCDSSDFYVFEVYNAKIGTAYDLFSTLLLPDGLELIPGSCEISYPAGAPWQSIADPQSNGAQLLWKMNDLLQLLLQNGLPGISDAPDNAYRIRFKTRTACGFVANLPILYGVYGVEACGRPTNQLNKAGAPVSVQGLNADYGVIVGVNADASQVLTCGSSQTFEVTAIPLGAPGPGDSIYVNIPAFSSFVAGSYTPLLNAPTQAFVSGNLMRLAFPPGTSAGTQVKFKFTIQYNLEAACSNDILRVQTRVQTSVFCPTIGQNCSVYLSTSDFTYPIDVQPWTLQLQDGAIVVNNGIPQVQTTVLNAGTTQVNQFTLQFWNDVDGSGTLTPTDQLLDQQNINANLAPGAAYAFSNAVQGINGTSCSLLLVLSGPDNCACQDVVLPVQQSEITVTEQKYCGLVPAPVGVLQAPGFQYQWDTQAGLGCINCPATVFTPPANTPSGTTFDLYLNEINGACKVRYHFRVRYELGQADPIPPQALCFGETFTLTAGPDGAQYSWQGFNLQQPLLQTQQLIAEQSTVYTVIVTTPNGCTATASTTVTVFPKYQQTFPPALTCAGVPVEVLGQLTDIPGMYEQLLQTIHGCDSLVRQLLILLPPVTTTENRSICSGDTLFLPQWDTLLTQSGQYCRTFTQANGCDSTHCIQLNLLPPPPGGAQDTIYGALLTDILLSSPYDYVQYLWPDLVNGGCSTCPDVTVQFDSAGYYEIILTGIGDGGCPAQVVYRIVIVPPCDPTNLDIPNAFTPNGDSINDVFRVVPFEGTELVASLTIYDRWGEKVYANVGNAVWDGTIDGQPAPMDVYVYIVEILCDGERTRRVGDVTLIR